MGASNWIYYIPYQEDLTQAFHDLRQREFESGFWAEADNALAAIKASGLDGWGPEGFEQWLEEVREEEASEVEFTPPQTIEELLESTLGQGTHSILDITSISTDPREREFEHIPLPPEILHQFFSSSQPTREVVEAIVTQGTLWLPIQRWIKSLESAAHSGIYSGLEVQFQKDVFPFFHVERSTEELVEALVAQEEVWIRLYPWIKSNLRCLDFLPLVGKAVPFSRVVLKRYFGTEKPTRAIAEAVLAQPEAEWTMYRNVGYYTVLYEDEAPSEIVFAGRSGD